MPEARPNPLDYLALNASGPLRQPELRPVDKKTAGIIFLFLLRIPYSMKTDKKEILRELLLSENRGFVLSIKLNNQSQPVKTAVRHADHNKIILEETCIFGHPLDRTVITLMDIDWVKRYKVLYNSPVYESIRLIKDNIRVMRNRIGMIAEQQQYQ